MAIARWLHLMGVVVWIGGMFFAHLALRPAALALPPPARLALMSTTLSRFLAWAGVAVVAILGSGAWMAMPMGGLGALGVSVHAMTAIGLVMALVYAYIVAAPYRTLRTEVAASHWEAAGAAMATIRRLVALNLALGLLTIAIAVLGRAA
ncbi:MAG: CopD family protein [Betaproteobacteria bacterium]